jgi:hypothetical protein
MTVGFKYDWRVREEVASTSKALKRAADQLDGIVKSMEYNDIEQIILPWVQATWDTLDEVPTIADHGVVITHNQVLSKQQGRSSQYVAAMEKSFKDVTRRNEKKALDVATGNSPPQRRAKRAVIKTAAAQALADLESQGLIKSKDAAQKKPPKKSVKKAGS